MTVDDIKRIAIIGAGTMGQGIAHVCAVAGFEVLLHDLNPVALNNGIVAIQKSLAIAKSKNKISEHQESEAVKKITPIGDIEQLQADLVIEAVAEDLSIKRNLFATLERVNAGACIFTSNTSSIPITKIASGLKNPNRFAGLHFFNPAPVMKLIEIIQGAQTEDNTIATLKKFAASLNKTGVVVKDSPGFIANRVARHFYVETLKLSEEGIASIETIDKLLKSTGFKMGPFELMDLIGIDINYAVTSSLYHSFHQDPKFRPNIIQQKKIDANHLGIKTGKGFYNYS